MRRQVERRAEASAEQSSRGGAAASERAGAARDERSAHSEKAQRTNTEAGEQHAEQHRPARREALAARKPSETRQTTEIPRELEDIN